ncbi:GYF domain-containing protein [Haloferula chungangensis]|uniref:GYF domain-containing protein n=1 Tax=Haloferula chungangensis TaxID=1048331 RepID=A0ABW2L0Q7_9BACT
MNLNQGAMAKWYYSLNGVQQGPVDDEEMRAMLASGMIQASTLVWRDGMDRWVPLASQPEWSSQIASPMGTPIPAYSVAPPTNGLAIASMVLGLLSMPIMLGCAFGILAAIPAVICGHLSLGQLKVNAFQTGRGFAITGIVTGYLTILITLIAVAVFGFVIAKDIK